MNLSLFRACELLGIAPPVRAVPNALKIYELEQVVGGVRLLQHRHVVTGALGVPAHRR